MTDIRDVLKQLPYPPDDATRYALTDLFTVRHKIIRGLDPQPRSVFEFGALKGFFLVTALDAAPSIEIVGWVDNEQHTPGSNLMVEVNLDSITDRCAIEWWRDRGDVPAGLQFDLVQVDSDHSYAGCLADLEAAAKLEPSWIMVDDWISETHIADIQAATLDWVDEQQHIHRVRWELTEHQTVNGLALLTRLA